MGLYQKHILPRLIDLAMRHRDAARLRAEVVPGARGRVLEIGIGSGLNLPFYGGEATALVGLDPSPELLAMAERARDAANAPLPVELIGASAEDLPFEDRSFDTVLTTWTLCSIPDAGRALAEMRRVLKPTGELIFIEHGRAPEEAVRRWQDRINPLWRRLAGGCNLNRDIPGLVAGAGFDLRHLESGYMIKGPRPMTYTYEGRARRA